MGERLKLLRTINVSQLSLYGAVSDLCEENMLKRRDLLLAGQSDPLFEPAKTPTPSIETVAQENLLQLYEERVESDKELY